MAETTPLLEVEDLTVRYEPKLGEPLTAVDGVSFTLGAGEFVGLIGESGCGKSTLGTALLRLLTPPAKLTGGIVRLDGSDLLAMSEDDLRMKRWRELSTVFQSSMNSLNPVVRIRHAFRDVFAAHTDLSRTDADRRAAELLEMVQIDPKFLDSYPHELSGGMKQRINLALALALEPRFVLLDEPTTGLDVVVQRTILSNVRRLQEEQGFTVLFISHDMGTVLETSDRILVMYAGRIVEAADSKALLKAPQHPYSKALLGSYGDPRSATIEITYLPGRPPDLRDRPRGCAFAERCPEVTAACREIDPPLYDLGTSEAACIVAAAQHGQGPLKDEATPRVEGFAGPSFTKTTTTDLADRGTPILEVEGVTKRFVRRQGLRTTTTDAVRGVDLTLRSGVVTALVGESGSGKSTIAKLVTADLAPTSGTVRFLSSAGTEDTAKLHGRRLLAFRKDVQYVFQDPYAALNPAHPIGVSLAAPLRSFEHLRGPALRSRASELLERVGLPGDAVDRFPYQLSGGQRQRVVIARALAPRPRLLIADEPIASLDVSIRAEILELLDSLVEEQGVGMLYITHDLLSARMIADEVVVLNKGAVVERGDALEVITNPKDPYTKELLAAVADPTAMREEVA